MSNQTQKTPVVYRCLVVLPAFGSSVVLISSPIIRCDVFLIRHGPGSTRIALPLDCCRYAKPLVQLRSGEIRVGTTKGQRRYDERRSRAAGVDTSE